MPSPQERSAILEEYLRTRTREAMGALIEANHGLIASIAKNYRNRGLDFEDLWQEGALGLQVAAKRFEPALGTFATIASYYIRGYILRAIQQTGRAIRLPVHVHQKLMVIRRAERDGDTLALSEAEARATKFMRASRAVSIETEVGDGHDGGIRLGDLLADSKAIDPAVRLDHERLSHIIREALDVLTPKEKEVIALRFGFTGEEKLTLSEIGERIGRTKQRAAQIEIKALAKLSKKLEGLALSDFELAV